MDPQKLAQLDPKLRDAYTRVMGTTIPEPQAASTQIQIPVPPTLDPTPTQQPQPKPEPMPTAAESTPSPIVEPTPTVETPTTPPIEPISQPAPAQQASNFVQMNSEVPAAPAVTVTPNFSSPVQAQAVVVKKKSNVLMMAIAGIAVLVFIVIYSLFWARIFNFKLPFF